jgi:hypothetical protein
MKVVDGNFGGNKKEKDKASDVLQAAADFVMGLEDEGYNQGDVVVIYQTADSPCIIMSNQVSNLDRTATLLQFAQQDVLSAIWYTQYSTEEPEDGTIH